MSLFYIVKLVNQDQQHCTVLLSLQRRTSDYARQKTADLSHVTMTGTLLHCRAYLHAIGFGAVIRNSRSRSVFDDCS